MVALFCTLVLPKIPILMAGVPLNYFLYLAAFLFSLGFLVVLTRRNIIVVLMGIELMLNAANLNLVAFSYADSHMLQGQIFTLFTIVIAAAEAAVGLALIINVYKHYQTTNLDEINNLNG
jgi:NADH:ubiquinone oxidoreductase subunit K